MCDRRGVCRREDVLSENKNANVDYFLENVMKNEIIITHTREQLLSSDTFTAIVVQKIIDLLVIIDPLTSTGV